MQKLWVVPLKRVILIVIPLQMPVNGIPLMVVYAGRNLITMLMVTDRQNVECPPAGGSWTAYLFSIREKGQELYCGTPCQDFDKSVSTCSN